MTKYLRVKNWEDFQHYKDRCPPWIKLHRDLLRDYEFLCLQDASKLHLMLIWLLASQMDNKIPADPKFIKSQLGVTGSVDLKELINKGFLIDDSGLLAGCKQVAIVETEAETETYREEVEKDIVRFDEFWDLYGIKKGRAKCEVSYQRNIRSGVKHETIMEGLRGYQAECKKNSTAKEFIKNPLTWLNGKHWEDEYERELTREERIAKIEQDYNATKQKEANQCIALN